MTFEEFSAALNLNDETAALMRRTGWDESMKVFPGVPVFVNDAFVNETFPKLRYPENLAPRLCEVCGVIRSNPALQSLAWHMHRAMFLAHPWHSFASLPLFEEHFGSENAGLFNLLIAMSSIPLMEARFRADGIPESVVLAQPQWLAGTIDIFKGAHSGRPGHDLRQTTWLRLAINGVLFRIGRFEFLRENGWPSTYPALYREKNSGKFFALALPGWKFDADGIRLPDAAESFALKTEFEERDGLLRATRILPDGTLDPAGPVTLKKNNLESLLEPWDLLFSLHIPGGGKMTLDIARESLLQARELLQTHFKRRIPLIFCHSWILSPEWRTVLPESNLAAFQRAVYNVPVPCYPDGRDGLFFIFGHDETSDPSAYSPDNSMRHAMIQVLKEKRPLRSGGMFLLFEDAERLAENMYGD